jgi:hypothetical protein
MNLFKKDPKKIFQLLAAILTVVFTYYMAAYFVRTAAPNNKKEEKPIVPPSVTEREEPQVNYQAFGPIHLEVNSPSYAKSNFDVSPLTPITIYFNENIDQDALLKNFSLTNRETGESIAVNLSSRERNSSDNEENYNWKWQRYWQQKVILTPEVELQPVTMYQVEIMPGISNEDKTHTTAQGMTFNFLTADNPGILSTNNKEEGGFSKREYLKVIFNSPMSLSELEEKISLSPSADYIPLVNDKIMDIPLKDFSAGEYTLTIPESTKDIYGRVLGQTYTINFSVI